MRDPVFILVDPQLPENIGMSARIMRNFGFCRLRLVNPREEWPNSKALASSADALKIMDEVIVFASLEDAVADLSYIIATTARDRHQREVTSDINSLSSLPDKTGIIFGAERRGLTNQQIAIANTCLKIPVDESFPSMNLAQAVAVSAFAIASIHNSKKQPTNHEQLADKASINALFSNIVSKLEQKLYFSDQTKVSKTLKIQHVLNNANLSSSDVRLLQGIIKSISQ